MSETEVLELLVRPGLLNEVRKKVQYESQKIETDFTQGRIKSVEWRRRQLMLAQSIIELIRDTHANG